ncbi:CDP-glucose 4,6-dehydratase [Paenibacillus thermotolerans]|uniref:CDP-glucose 4,6-dehydratase n=1 Tax=Paenibacillus thermotolerans TaxID=3027807 RepID=UPI0023688787|nr:MULTISPECIES: CDP-glucose 4,6-dehydratase [unclassified Paenibacillus]
MREFWRGKKVFVTGHTGFKGSWLCIWLSSLGAKVVGYATKPPTAPSLFELCKVEQLLVKSVIGDIRNLELLKKEMTTFQPSIVIHMAAQPLVRESYKNPADTYSINVMGTVNLFEAARSTESVKAILNVTTDKCYENKEWVWGYRENEPMGGYDPYSSSKACSELITSSYRNSYFNIADYEKHGVAVASARAGNVIGGGDWAADRLIPDCLKSLLQNEPVVIRNPHAIRPWQHVLEPLSGYLLLAQKLYEDGPRFAEAWNFGPHSEDAKPVEWIVQNLIKHWGKDTSYVIDKTDHHHEANYLKLDWSKASMRLNWHPKWSLENALSKIIEWVHSYQRHDNVRNVCLRQIEEYSNS